jgi:cell division protein FtsZ
LKEKNKLLFFDLPILKPEPVTKLKRKVLFELNETRDIKVNEPVEFVPVTELSENGIIKYSLEEYMEADVEFVASKPAAKNSGRSYPC